MPHKIYSKFPAFLESRSKDRSPVGDVAREWAEDDSPLKPANPRTWKVVLAYLTDVCNADDSFIRAYEKAWNAWKNGPGKLPLEDHIIIGAAMTRARKDVMSYYTKVANAGYFNPELVEAVREIAGVLDNARWKMENQFFEDYPKEAHAQVYFGPGV